MKRRALICLLLAAAVWWLIPKPPLLDGVPLSQEVLDRDGKRLRITLAADDKYRLHTPLEEISPQLTGATLAHEDQWFYWHRGVNPVAVLRSATRVVARGHSESGASTITMQLVRLRYGLHTRTWRGKLLQIARAVQVERHYSKREILEAYFTLAPYGRNIEGAGAASALYFNKTPARLTSHEALALSTIPQSPTRRARAGQAQSSIAPHFIRQVLERDRSSPRVQTTLDSRLQQQLEKRVRAHVRTGRGIGVENAAALLVDFHTMEVLAQVGSADFFDERIQGQVDGTRSRRSPGSTLKPFVYALAIDEGLIHPRSLLVDTQRSFADYNPENYDRAFAGPIHATEALARSRNVPAVALASQLRRVSLYGFLRGAGVMLPRDEKSYGLTLPLGGGEVTMEQLVRLYCALASGGRLRPLHRTLPHTDERGRAIVTPEAAFLTLEMLGTSPRPGMFDSGAVYWKTGTSHGFRDAWSVAVFDRSVLAVWVGNFDGRGNPAFIGRSCAAPLLFEIVDAVRDTRRIVQQPLTPPAGGNLRRVEFCAVSGALPNAECRHRVSGWFIPGVSPITRCEVHGADAAEAWSSDVVGAFERAGLPRRNAGATQNGSAPRILSPRSGVRYVAGAGAEIALRADAAPGVETVHWFVEKTLIATSAANGSGSWKPGPGRYTVVAVDDQGRSSRCDVEVIAAVVTARR